MKKLAERYNNWCDEEKNLFIFACIGVVGFLILLFGFFIDNPGLPIGWLLGTAIELVAYFTIWRGTAFLLDPQDKDGKRGYLMAVFALGRLFLYAGGLVLAAFCSFVWGTLAHGYCNLWTVFAGYMPEFIVLIFVTFFRLKKKPAAAPAPKEEPAPEAKEESAEEGEEADHE